MKIHNHEVIVHRNETFSLSKNVLNKDGSPFIISNKFNSPYWLITISSARYNQTNRYVYNRWLDIKTVPRFEITKPIDLKSIDVEYEYSDMIPSGYEGDETSGYANIAVFYDSGENPRTYKYWVYDNNDAGDYSGHWETYYCNITTTFTKTITSEWTEQTYYYGILLVDGIDTLSYLKDTCEKYQLKVSNDIQLMYETLLKFLPESVAKISDLNRPLIEINHSYPILNPTKMSVQSNMKGMM